MDCGLVEERKWGVPCYTLKGANVLMIYAFKNNCGISFLKGSLMADPHHLLEKAGENSQVGRMIRFTDVEQIQELEPILKTYVFEAIEVERSGIKPKPKPVSQYEVPVEFQRRLEADPDLKAAYEALTPGRQKGYLLYFSAAKQSKTRESRIDKYTEKILKGLGFHD